MQTQLEGQALNQHLFFTLEASGHGEVSPSQQKWGGTSPALGAGVAEGSSCELASPGSHQHPNQPPPGGAIHAGMATEAFQLQKDVLYLTRTDREPQ